MTRAILPRDVFAVVQQLETNAPVQPSSEQERLKIVLIGSATGVREMIHRLHQRGIAEAGAWSRFVPVPETEEVMSVLLQYRRRG